MPARKLKEFLDKNHVTYVTIQHARTFSAQETAAATHISGKKIAKTVVVEMDGEMVMAVLPATEHLDCQRLREALHAESVIILDEAEFRSRFPDCELGAMPPFGNLYDMRVVVDEHLREAGEIAFNAGTHTELVGLNYQAFERLVDPVVTNCTMS